MQLHPDSCPMEPMATGEESYSVLSGRYSYKLLAKKRLPLQLQVTVLKSLTVTFTSYSIFS